MTKDPANYRAERIERLFRELKYEVTRGIMEREIDISIGFRFYVPNPDGGDSSPIRCEFRSEPDPYNFYGDETRDPQLKVIDGGRE